MKKITTPAGVFGPFDRVQTGADGYLCDDAEWLPFAVIGAGEISDWVGALPVAAVHVPASVSMTQARLALLQRNLLDSVEAAMASQPRAVRIEWEFRPNVDRASPLVAGMQAILGLNNAEVDDLFRLAEAL